MLHQAVLAYLFERNCRCGIMAQWLSWLERRPVTAEVTSSNLVWVVVQVSRSDLAREKLSSKRGAVASEVRTVSSIGGLRSKPTLYYMGS